MSEENMMYVQFGGKECHVTPFEGQSLPESSLGYTRLSLSDSQKGRISALCQQFPTLMSAAAMDNAYYVVKWPEGLPHELVKAKNGPGVYCMVRNEKGQFGGHAQFAKMSTQSIVLSGFTALSIVSSQYFLVEINQRMTMISRSIDKILEFLYGDKKAELLSEISFVKYAYENFASIMERDEQRIATIQSLQEAKKTAIKDIEFYLEDLYSITHAKDSNDISATVDKAFQIRQCLQLAIQLYVTGNLMEVYYSQNYDPDYLQYIENDVGSYITKCDKQMLGCFHALYVTVDGFKKFGKKVDLVPLLERVNKAIEPLEKADENSLKSDLRNGLYSAEMASEYCVGTDGTVYLKAG